MGLYAYLPFSELGLFLVKQGAYIKFLISRLNNICRKRDRKIVRVRGAACLQGDSCLQTQQLDARVNSQGLWQHAVDPHRFKTSKVLCFLIFFIFWKVYTLTKCIFIMSIYYYWSPTCLCVPRSASFSITSPLIVLLLRTPESN